MTNEEIEAIRAALEEIDGSLDVHLEADGETVPAPSLAEATPWHPGIHGPLTFAIVCHDFATTLLAEVDRLHHDPTPEAPK